MYIVILGVFSLFSLLGYSRGFNQAPGTRALLIVLCLLTIVVVGTRYESVDYYAYLEIYNRLDFKNFNFPLYSSPADQTTGNEFIFATLTTVFKFLGIEPVWWFLTIAACSITLKILFLKRNARYLWLALFMYISFSFFKELSQIRNALAISFLLFSMQYAIERRPYKFALMVFVASGIQIFALSMLPLYILGRADKKGAGFIFLFMLCLVSIVLSEFGSHLVRVFYFIHPLIASKLNGYLSSGGYELGGLYYFLLLGVFIVFLNGFFIKQPREYYVFSSFSFVGFIGYVMFGDAGELGNRFLDTYLFATLPIIASLMLEFGSRNLKLILYPYWMIFGFTIFIAKMQSAFVYQSVLFGL